MKFSFDYAKKKLSEIMYYPNYYNTPFLCNAIDIALDILITILSIMTFTLFKSDIMYVS